MYSTDFYYPAPFSVDKKRFYIVSKNGERVFNVLTKEKTIIDSIILKLNGESGIVFDGKFTHNENDGAIIKFNGTPILLVRGWGMLTNQNKFDMRPMETRNVIHTFIMETVNKLQENNIEICQKVKKKRKSRKRKKVSKNVPE